VKRQAVITNVIFQVLTAVTMKNVVFWDVTPFGSCRNRNFGVTYCYHHQGKNNKKARKNVTKLVIDSSN
jgi:hypothetical protein